MSNAARNMSPASASKWTVISGPMKGAVRLMNTPDFTVGRSPECEIVIVNDPKCSRKHAEIRSSGYGCEVISLNDKNLVLVNGREIERATLEDGDVVSFGDTKVQYQTTSTSTGSHLIALGNSAMPPSMPGTGAGGLSTASLPRDRTRSPAAPAKKPQGKGRLIFYGIIALAVGVFLIPTTPKKVSTLRTEAQIQADIETESKLKESEQRSVRPLDISITARQAQENFVRGFRDFKKMQYERAMMSFQSCLALNPTHDLCTFYARLSERKFNEDVRDQMIMGKKYRDQNQFQQCRSAYRNVMVMIKDANSKVYQEAKGNYDACDALVEGRF